MRRLSFVIAGLALLAVSCGSPAPTATPPASAPASLGPNRVEIWDRTLDPVLVAVGGSMVRVDACGYVILNGIDPSGQLEVKHANGEGWSMTDPNVAIAPFPSGRFVVVSADNVLDLRLTPPSIPACDGHLGPSIGF